MDVLANNIANMSTTAFKGEEMLFSRVPRPAARQRSRSPSSQDVGTVRDMRQGPVTRTGNPLDVALDGPGFLDRRDAARHALHPQRPSQARCARAARHRQGDPVLVECRRADPAAVQRQSRHDRRRRLDLGPRTAAPAHRRSARSQSSTSHKPQLLRRRPDGLYVTDQTPSRPARAPPVQQGMIEDSNVQPVVEMTRMMAVSRTSRLAKNFARRESTPPAQRHRQTRQVLLAEELDHASLMNIAATGMLAQQLNVEVISNNIANLNTTAFKRQRAEFQDLLYQSERARRRQLLRHRHDRPGRRADRHRRQGGGGLSHHARRAI